VGHHPVGLRTLGAQQVQFADLFLELGQIGDLCELASIKSDAPGLWAAIYFYSMAFGHGQGRAIERTLHG
jgi:hypothetical protein